MEMARDAHAIFCFKRFFSQVTDGNGPHNLSFPVQRIWTTPVRGMHNLSIIEGAAEFKMFLQPPDLLCQLDYIKGYLDLRFQKGYFDLLDDTIKVHRIFLDIPLSKVNSLFFNSVACIFDTIC
jgi:hypothetical protein